MSEAHEPRAHRIERPTADDGMAATSHSTACCGLCAMRSGTAPRARKQRAETVFYDSSTARRSLLGALHYCVACPGWAMATSERVVYSRWDMYALSELPAQCCANLCCEREAGPPPDPTTFKSPDGAKRGDDGACCACRPCGRTLDHFDADIIVASRTDPLPDLPRRGRVVLYRKAGGDLSDPDELFVMTDVAAVRRPQPHDVRALQDQSEGRGAQGVGARRARPCATAARVSRRRSEPRPKSCSTTSSPRAAPCSARCTTPTAAAAHLHAHLGACSIPSGTTAPFDSLRAAARTPPAAARASAAA